MKITLGILGLLSVCLMTAQVQAQQRYSSPYGATVSGAAVKVGAPIPTHAKTVTPKVMLPATIHLEARAPRVMPPASMHTAPRTPSVMAPVSTPEEAPAPAPMAPVATHAEVVPPTIISTPVAGCEGCGGCDSHCHSKRGWGRSCWDKIRNWLSYRPSKCTSCGCKGCNPCYPPLYTYFLHRCSSPGYCAPHHHHAGCGCSNCGGR